jgi:hypothetical protein
MHFLPDVYVTCEVCKGKRYGRETLEVRYKGLNIAEVLDLTAEQARELFSSHPRTVVACARHLELACLPFDPLSRQRLYGPQMIGRPRLSKQGRAKSGLVSGSEKRCRPRSTLAAIIPRQTRCARRAFSASAARLDIVTFERSASLFSAK